MVALKAADIDSFLARPDPGKLIVLVFGPGRLSVDGLIAQTSGRKRD